VEIVFATASGNIMEIKFGNGLQKYNVGTTHGCME
jgi:hypothetical protein